MVRYSNTREQLTLMRHTGAAAAVVLQHHRMHVQSAANRHKAHAVQRQPVVELAEVHPVDGHLVVGRLRQHDDLERGADVDRTVAVALLVAPGARLQVVAHDGVLGGPDAQVQGDIGARADGGASLQVDVEPIGGGGVTHVGDCGDKIFQQR